MNSIVLLSLSFLAVFGFVPAYGQFSLPFGTDSSDCSAASRLLDPYWALKLKYPKKFNSKLDYAKDLLLDAKYRQTAKLLSRHMKNLNVANCDLQNLMYQAQQPSLLAPVICPEQSALAQQQQQQQQLATLQIPIEATRGLTLTPQTDSQVTCYPQLTDPRYQQPTFQLTGAQSKRFSKQRCPCNCHEGDEESDIDSPFPKAVSSVVSTFLGALKSFLK